MRLEHVNLTVADLERSVAFYTDLLDLHVRWRGHTSAGREAVHLGDDQWYLALFEGEAQPMEIDYGRVGYNHFGVVVDDLDDTTSRLAGLGATIHLEAEEEPFRRAYFYDPDGYEVELVQYSAS